MRLGVEERLDCDGGVGEGEDNLFTRRLLAKTLPDKVCRLDLMSARASGGVDGLYGVPNDPLRGVILDVVTGNGEGGSGSTSVFFKPCSGLSITARFFCVERSKTQFHLDTNVFVGCDLSWESRI